MVVIFAYRYGIAGGVATQLLLRQAALTDAGMECHLFFSQDNGLRQILGDETRIHFGTDSSVTKLMRRVRPDALFVVDSPELLSARGIWTNCPVYLDVHTTTKNGLAYLDELVGDQLKLITVPTEYSATLVGKRIPDANVSILPNILNTKAFELPKVQHLKDGPSEFIWVGKLDNHKNWRMALVYTRLLIEHLGDVRMTMVGGFTAPDETAADFFALVHRLGIVDQVRWVDRLENSQLANLYHLCARTGGAMLVTSKNESFGMAAAEALLCGCPLIANDLPAFREIFPPSNMIQLVNIWNPEAFVEAVRQLPHRTTADAALVLRENISSKYSPEAFSAKFLSLF